MSQNPPPIQQRIEIDADTQGAEEVKRALGGVEEANEQADRATDKATQSNKRNTDATRENANAQRDATTTTKATGSAQDDAAKKSDSFAGALNRVTKAAASMFAGFLGFDTIIRYFQALNEAARTTVERLEQIADKANEAAQATLDLHAINLGFSPDDERIVSGFSQATGRSFQESAAALTRFRSSTASLSREEQDVLFQEALLPLALTTNGDINPASKFIGRISSITQDPEQIKNLVAQSVALAGEADPSQFLGAAGQLLVTGNAAGLSPADTLSFLGFLTRDFESAEASTGGRNIIDRLTANPEVLDKLRDLGVDSSGGLFSSLDQLAQRQTSQAEVIDLVGTENARFLTAAITGNDDLNTRRQQTADALQSGDLVGEMLADITGRSPRHARALQIAQQSQRLEALEREDAERAQVIRIARNAIEYQLEAAVQDGTLDASAKQARLEVFDGHVGNLNFRSHARGRLGSINIPGMELTPEQEAYLDARYDEDDPRRNVKLPKSLLTPQQIAIAAAQSVESSGLLTDLVPGGNQSDFVELSDFVNEELRTGPQLPGTVINQTIINDSGTKYIGAGDPLKDDLDGRLRQ